jgi:hypothetical protein
MRKILVLIVMGFFGVAMLPTSSAYAKAGKHHRHHGHHHKHVHKA